MTGQNTETNEESVLTRVSHSGNCLPENESGQSVPVKTQDQVEGARLSDADFHEELTAVIPHLRAFARMLCGDRDRADDLAQEALMKAWAARGSFIAGTRFRAWIYTILRHLYFGQIRRERFVGEYNEAEAERVLTIPGSQEGRLEAADVLRALATLPATQREVLVLMCVGGVSYEEVAEICGTPLGTVKSRIARARAAISAAIDGGLLPDVRSKFDLKDDVHDAFFEELRKVAPAHVLERRVT
ncbi:sigma-70 family RNA polymerase sigma factor [Novosphingobium terrae]|uniref:sigma-70 family RNA polymerase sigma factor n=1 Tax=Novosphingobium terrae TaxID=2726189 RepID=UPI001F143B18|nr:sigma-70 family RNA polymerase sigma factor [Novosphingobium terrae]